MTAPAPFAPWRLGPLALANRLIKTATFEGSCPGGKPSAALLEHHRRIAAGGVGMTTVAYCSVSADGRTYASQILMRREVVPDLAELTAAIHAAGAKASVQLNHCGSFASARVIGGAPVGPSRGLNLYGLAVSRPATRADLSRIATDFAQATRIAGDAGFDAVELHAGHGYLLSQFLSPHSNHRRDEYGQSLANRLRFPREVLAAVRAAAGTAMAVLVKMNLRDGFAGGLELAEAVEVARAFAGGGADALVLSGGFVSKTPFYMLRGDLPVKEMAAAQPQWHARVGLTLFGKLLVPAHPFTEAFFLEEARAVRAATALPLVLVGGIKSLAGIEAALDAGFDAVAMGRALIHDPELPRKMQQGTSSTSACVPCNVCVAEMDRGNVRCVLADAPSNAAAPLRNADSSSEG